MSPRMRAVPQTTARTTGTGPTGLGTVDLDAIKGFHAVFSELGGDTVALLTRAGLDANLIAAGGGTHGEAPLDVVARLLAQASREVHCPHFGLQLGQRLETSLLGPIAFLMMHSPDVQSALQYLFRFLHVRARGVTLSLDSQAANAQFRLDSPVLMLEGGDQIEDLGLANYIGFMRIACGKAWTPKKVLLRHAPPKDPSPWHELFGRHVRFGQPLTAMQFPAAELKRPMHTADVGIGDTLRRYILQIEAEHQGDIVAQVRHVLPTLLPTGKCSIDRVAELFGMHRRTLHRKLAAESLTFEKLLDNIRRDMAMRMLANPSLPTQQVAVQLGYHDLSAFSRAFRRWAGQSPTDWRRCSPEILPVTPAKTGVERFQ